MDQSEAAIDHAVKASVAGGPIAVAGFEVPATVIGRADGQIPGTISRKLKGGEER